MSLLVGITTKMKFEYGLIIIVGFLVSVSLGLISIQPNEIPHWNYLQEMKQQEFADGCDIDCKERQENERGYLCVPLDSEQYICRPPRDIFYPDEDMQVRSVFPPTYGEFVYVPENKEMMAKNRLFDIAKVTLLNEKSKEIMVEFGFHTVENTDNYFEYSAVLLPGDTFVSHCLGGNSKTAHIVEYRDTIQMEEKTYLEFWGTHVTMPDKLLPCKMPDLISHSLSVNLGSGISFGE